MSIKTGIATYLSSTFWSVPAQQSSTSTRQRGRVDDSASTRPSRSSEAERAVRKTPSRDPCKDNVSIELHHQPNSAQKNHRSRRCSIPRNPCGRNHSQPQNTGPYFNAETHSSLQSESQQNLPRKESSWRHHTRSLGDHQKSDER